MLQAKWVFDATRGEIYSVAYEEFGGKVCLTTGWPFLQVGAFDTAPTGDKSKTVVILNEAGETANYVLKNGGETILSSAIPPHSIQTISYD